MKKIFNSFALKIIAISSMTIDHIGYFLFPKIRILRILGRLAFPIFAFLTSVSMQYSKNKIKHICILLGCGLVFSLVASLFSHQLVPNVFIDLGLGALCCLLLFNNNNLSKIAIAIIVLYSISPYNLTEYKIFGIVAVLIFYVFHSDMKLGLITYSVWTILAVYLQKLSIFDMILVEGEFLLLPIIFIYLYNGKRGFYHPTWKYSFYVYYPLHVSILYLIREVL